MYQEGKRAAILPPPSSNSETVNIIERAISFFQDLAEKNKAEPTVQSYDADFDEWVDV